MYWYTCKSLLNTLGRAVEQLAGCLAKQIKQKSALKVNVQQHAMLENVIVVGKNKKDSHMNGQLTMCM